jgi:hypothetical protein
MQNFLVTEGGTEKHPCRRERFSVDGKSPYHLLRLLNERIALFASTDNHHSDHARRE